MPPVPPRVVDIDDNGDFKYILVQISQKDSKEKQLIVRGYASCDYHADINDKVTEELNKFDEGTWRSKVLGGGRIKRDAQSKQINVYGYSQGYGKADHQKAVEVLKTAFPDHNITCSL